MKIKVITRKLCENTYGEKFEIADNLLEKGKAISTSVYMYGEVPMIAITVLMD